MACFSFPFQPGALNQNVGGSYDHIVIMDHYIMMHGMGWGQLIIQWNLGL